MKKPKRKIRKAKCSERKIKTDDTEMLVLSGCKLKMSKLGKEKFLKLIEARIKAAEKALLKSMREYEKEQVEELYKAKNKK
jgi:cytoplasmic iron level regulating protein YaaA (DUF328/UPF0246 family)